MNDNLKNFYEAHRNFSDRRISEYFLSPGIRCKFDLLKKNIKMFGNFLTGIDLGCSGNSFLYFFKNIRNKCFLDLVKFSLKQYISNDYWHPTCSDISDIPYRNESFDFVSALSVLEHVKNDMKAISEISRITKKGGVIIITVPHRMKYFTNQDALIGHYRRYEIPQITQLFEDNNMKMINKFGIYGQLMRISDIQSLNPDKLEKNLTNLRNRYESSMLFRITWTILVWFGAKIMRIDAKRQKIRKIMNIAFVFKKI